MSPDEFACLCSSYKNVELLKTYFNRVCNRRLRNGIEIDVIGSFRPEITVVAFASGGVAFAASEVLGQVVNVGCPGVLYVVVKYRCQLDGAGCRARW
jgi:hypothetical protein